MSERLSRRPVSCTLLAVAVSLAGARTAGAAFGDPMGGQALFVSKGCVQCHAVRGAGGRIGPDLGRTAVKGSFFELAAAMWNHSFVMDEKMKEFRLVRPTFKKSEMADLLAFVFFLNYFDEPGDPRIGKILFAEKHCIQCHKSGREGGSTGPRLDKLPRGTPPLQIAQGLWNHGPSMVAAIRRMGMSVPKFEGSEIVDLFAFVRSQGERRSAIEFHAAGDPVNGKRLFSSKGCARCHGLGGGASIGAIGPDLATSELRGSVTELAGRMWNHWPAMAEAMGALGMATPTFHADELADLFAYVFLVRYEGRSGGRSQGEAIYQRSGCASCHGDHGQGNVGPSLRTATAGESKEEIAQRMWNHAPAMGQSMRARGLPWPRFEAEELAALLRLLAEGWTEPARPAPSTKTAR